jgi:adenosylhomocysteinase
MLPPLPLTLSTPSAVPGAVVSTSDDRAFKAEAEIGRINAFFPILPRLGNRWAASRPWEGRTLALNLHVTTLTGALLRELALGGGTFLVSAANPATTDPGTVQFLRNQGIEVYTGGDMEDRHLQILAHGPDLLVDVGLERLGALLDRRAGQVKLVRGAVELTRSGITRLRGRADIPFPIVNINDGRLKNAVENRHGVGEAMWQAVARLTGMHLSGRRVAIIGYGAVGRGLAAYARAAGMCCEVVERDSVRRLFAHYDGFPTPPLREALSRANLVVTATGVSGAVTADELIGARDGIVLANAGHGGDEIDVAGIQRAATRVDNVAEHVVRYRLESGTRVTVLGHGHPLNIVVNSGSPEPVLLHFAVLGLALEWVARFEMPPGEVLVPDEIEDRAAALALESLDLAGA